MEHPKLPEKPVVEDTIGKRIQLERQRRNVKQAILAKDIGMDSSKLSDIENSKYSPSWNDIVNIATSLNCEIFEILPDVVIRQYLKQVKKNKDSINSNREEIDKLWEVVNKMRGNAP